LEKVYPQILPIAQMVWRTGAFEDNWPKAMNACGA